MNQHRYGAPTRCVCPECGFEKEKVLGRPCREEICPKCGNRMIRLGGMPTPPVEERHKE